MHDGGINFVFFFDYKYGWNNHRGLLNNLCECVWLKKT